MTYLILRQCDELQNMDTEAQMCECELEQGDKLS